MNKGKLYRWIGTACAAGYTWLFYVMKPAPGFAYEAAETPTSVCLVKHVTSIPCPSCGSTRSVLAMLQGDWWGAILLNPMGYLIAAVLVIAPLWILFDILTKRSTLFHSYQRAECTIAKPSYAIPLLLLVAVNWIWNIVKGI